LDDRRKEELFSKKVKAGRRTYYFDVKENVNSDKYLIISETKAVDFGKQDRFRIMVFPEDIDNFQEAFTEVVNFIKSNEFMGQARSMDETEDDS
jgi:mannitol/fructose-specific phosphotransferase system IIA component (Ntr-type)